MSAVTISGVLTRLKPYWLHAYLLTYLPFLLVADSHITALWQQWLLGLLTFVGLYVLTFKVPKGQRTQIWMCVVVATGFEIIGSLVWGVYRYRLHNLPLFVPPGHGGVYLFGLLTAQTPLVMRYGRRVGYVVLTAAGAWAIGGLTMLPLVTGRWDMQGALCLPVFAWFVLRSPRWALFAGIFIVTGMLEIVGTSLGNWYWLPIAPWTHIPSGNPPSVIAGGYCVIDATVLLAMRGLAAMSGRLTYRVGLNTIVARISKTPNARIGPSSRLVRATRSNSGDVVSPASTRLI